MLEYDEAAVRQGARLRTHLEGFVAEHRDEPLAWIALPFQAVVQTWHEPWRLAAAGPPLDRDGRRAERRRSLLAARTAPAGRSEVFRAGDVLLEAEGGNQQRAVTPVGERLGGLRRLPAATPSTRRLRALGRRAVRLADDLLRSARAADVPLTTDASVLAQHLTAAARALAHAEALLAAHRPRAVVVGASLNVPPRALIHAARVAGTPSVLIPHAPALRDAAYADVPVDHVALPGAAEVEHYAALAGGVRGLHATGAPGVPDDPPARPDPSLPPVLAPLLWPESVRRDLELLEGAGVRRGLVAPHPRADREALAAHLPAGWELWSGRTYALLRRGPPVLVLGYSSGVTLEALLLGVPVVELRPPGGAPNYAFVEEPPVRAAGDPDGLRTALAAATADGADPDRRARLRALAERWCAPRGPEAADRVAELVRDAATAGPSGPVWSGWALPRAR